MKNRKIQIIKIIFAFLIIVIATEAYIICRKEKLQKYVVLNENLVYEGKIYLRQVDHLIAVQLGEQCGITDLKQQVFTIQGEDKSKWICVREDEMEGIYKESSEMDITLQSLKPNVLVIKDNGSIESRQVKITDTTLIEKVVSQLTDKNRIENPINISVLKKVIMYSGSHPGLGYICYYAHNDDGKCYLMNSSKSEIWQIGHELMEYVM